MRCCAERMRSRCAAGVFIAGLCAGAPLAAQTVTVGVGASMAPLHGSTVVAPSPSHAFEMRVKAAVAARWGVDPALVHVAPASSNVDWPADDAAFSLMGSGADGVWLLDVVEDGRTSRIIVRSGTETDEPAATRDLERGATLAAADIEFRTVILPGPPKAPAEVVGAGWIARRRITRGETLRAPAVAPPIAVRTGDEVRLIFEQAGISITLMGRAAGQAAIGERVTVRAETGKRLEGIVTGAGIVRIGGPGNME